jgi:hypothetical protein
MICPKCGTENGDSSMKCVKCWRPLQPVEKGPWLSPKGKLPEQIPAKKSPQVRVRRIASILLVMGVLFSVFAPSVIEKIREYENEGRKEKAGRKAIRPARAPKEGKTILPDVPKKEQGNAPHGIVPSLGAKVTSLHFFESGYHTPAMGQRIYADRFLRDRCRYINWELRLNHPQREKRVDFRIDEVWYKPDGSILAKQSLSTRLQKTWVHSFHHHSWGWDEPSHWPPGQYRVDLSVNGASVAVGLFTVTGTLTHQ